MPQFVDFLDPAETAIVCMEMQRGVVGDLSNHPAAKAVAESGMIARIAGLFDEARRCGITVIHCTAAFRPDRIGSYGNIRMLAPVWNGATYLATGTAAAAVVPELLDERDFVSERFHGISPFTDTSADPALRSLGAKNIVAVGVSLNRGIIGVTIEAINRGKTIHSLVSDTKFLESNLHFLNSKINNLSMKLVSPSL